MSFADVADAAERLSGIARRTPILTSATLDAVTHARVYVKAEPFQRTGSFKLRGAYNACSRLGDGVPGVLTYSSGNHAQAVALASRLVGIPSVVVMPTDAPTVKIAATRGYGAEIVFYDRNETTREAVAEPLARERGMPVVPPYDHPDVIAGQGTVCVELFEELRELDLILVPCGGGGLLSGTAIAARTLCPSCKVVGVEPETADDAMRSFRTGVLQSVDNPQTIADGARTPSLGRYTFPIVRRLVDDMVTVSDDAILHAMRFLWERLKVVVEPTGALAAAALLTGAIDARGAKVGVVLSGGNVDFAAGGSAGLSA